MTDESPTAVTDQPVYFIYEHLHHTDDAIRLVFEDDAETLREVMDYYTRLAESDSQIVEGQFHAASPGDKHLTHGDHYLVKRHGVGISHGLNQ